MSLSCFVVKKVHVRENAREKRKQTQTILFSEGEKLSRRVDSKNEYDGSVTNPASICCNDQKAERKGAEGELMVKTLPLPLLRKRKEKKTPRNFRVYIYV